MLSNASQPGPVTGAAAAQPGLGVSGLWHAARVRRSSYSSDDDGLYQLSRAHPCSSCAQIRCLQGGTHGHL